MKNPINMGLNKTGVDMSPLDSKSLIEAAERTVPSSEGGPVQLAVERSHYIDAADPVGSVPVPGTLRGMAGSMMNKLGGRRPEVLIDKLGERLAFERAGVRLYDALITKCECSDAQAGSTQAMGAIVSELRQFRDEEARHFELVRDAMKSLGADPTAQTPGADTSAVASMGLIQVLADPRTTVAQSLSAILTAELSDNDGWRLLLRLAEEMGQHEMAATFRIALLEEDKHLQAVRSWLEQLILADAQVMKEKVA